MNRKRPTLNEVLKQASASTRRINISSGGALSRPRVRLSEAARALAAAAPDPQPQHADANESLEKARAGARSTEGGPDRPLVTFTLFRVKTLDAEAKYASVKFLLDALRYAKLIPEDRDQDIRLAVSQYRVDTYLGEGTGITIDYPDHAQT